MHLELRRTPSTLPIALAFALAAAFFAGPAARAVVPDCGDGVCVSGETCESCPSDCTCGGGPICGDLSCDIGEGCGTCPDDCGACSSLVCGNGYCEGSAGETCSTCAADCGACPLCGNGSCNSGEACFSCPADCGSCPPCGDGVCDAGESCSICSLDCGECQPTCGNAQCELGESCSTCAPDCGMCNTSCGNGACDPFESCATCPSDCRCGPEDLPLCNNNGRCDIEQCPCPDCCPTGGGYSTECKGDLNCAPGLKCADWHCSNGQCGPGSPDGKRHCIDEWLVDD